MKGVNSISKILIWAVVFISFSTISFSQTINDAISAYNSGLESKQAGNFEEALNHFNEAISIAQNLGEEGEEVLINVESQIPAIYYQIATELYREKKIDEAIEKFNETIEIADKYNDDDVKQKASKAITQLYYVKGATSYKQENFTDALDNFKKAVETGPDNTKAYYMVAVVYKNLDDDDNLFKAAKKSAEVAKANNDNKYYENSRKLASDYFLVKANSAKTSKKNDEAVKYLKNSLEFDSENTTTYFLLSQVYNAQSKWDESIESANKAMEYEKDIPEEKAKIYYELGNAFSGKGENSNACDAYKKAAIGAFKAAAEYQIEQVLKCQ